MMPIKLPWKAILACSMLTSASHVQASVLDDAVRGTILQALNRSDEQVKVSIDQRDQQADCEAPNATLPYPVPERGGRISVSILCDGQAPRYIQASVSILTPYVVSTRDIAPGELVTASMLRQATGDRASLPNTVLTDPSAAIGLQTTRRIKAGGYLQANSVKAQVLIARNARVNVVASGKGFSVRHDGTALDAGTQNGEIRVRLLGGSIVKATVLDKNTVTIPL